MSGRGYASTARSDTGCVRRVNEDAVLAMPTHGVWVVADGMGGHFAGTRASRTIVENLAAVAADLPFAARVARVRTLLLQTHDELIGVGLAQVPVSTVGATVVALVLGEGRFACLWAGDSRVYRLREDRLDQLTHDHSLVQQMVDRGLIDAAHAENHPDSHVVTRALGAPGTIELDTIEGEAFAGDAFLLCSDGLTRIVPLASIREAMTAADFEPAADALLETALARGAPDNVSFILVRALHG